jgi:UPF0755 protein
MRNGGHNQFMGEGPRDDRQQIGAPDDQTRAFSLDTAGKEPPERCEERSAIRDLPAGVLVWRMLRPLLILAISAALVWFLGSFGYRYVMQNYIAPVENDKSTVRTVQIKTGASLSAIASLLHDEGIIRNKLVFQLYVDFNDMSSKLQAGTYDLSPGMTIEEIMETLVAGDGGKEILKITLTEGMTANDMASTLVSKGLLSAAESREFLQLCNDAEAFDDYAFIAVLPDTAQQDGRRYLLEGYLFPDTYEFYADATPEDVIRKLLSRFDEIFTLTYEERAQELGMTIDEVVTLASVIQWEAMPGDFKKVSAVFSNRLAIEMPLQSCATLRYVTGEKKLAYSAVELSIESPYNTYQIRGLPIGPVSNPGRDAIVATLYPDETFMAEGEQYYYFCNKTPDSTELAFARTLEEHNANKAAYNAAAGTDTYDTDQEG